MCIPQILHILHSDCFSLGSVPIRNKTQKLGSLSRRKKINTGDGSELTQGTVLCVERGEEQLKCAYRKYYIVCIITVSHSEFCADLAQK